MAKNRIASRLLALTMAIVMAFSLTACGGGKTSNEPDSGKYTATTAETMGLELEVSALFGSGFTIDLYDNGKCDITVDGKNASGKWTLSGEAFTVSGGDFDASGTLKNGVMVLENVMDMGITLKLLREGTPSGSESPVPSNDDDTNDDADTNNGATTNDDADTDNGAAANGDADTDNGAAPSDGDTKSGANTKNGTTANDDSGSSKNTSTTEITIPSTWYGVMKSESLAYAADVWARFDDDGTPYFELWESLEDFNGAGNYSPSMSMYIESGLPSVVIPVADGNAWFLEHDFIAEDAAKYMGVLLDGMLYFSFEYDDGDGRVYAIEICLRENGAPWDEEHDPLPPGYETYKNGF